MRLWMTLMAGPGSLEDLHELWKPIKAHFSGLCATYHGDRADDEAIFLGQNCGAGKVIYLPFSQRHDFSRNAYLYCCGIEDGDYVMQCDTLERLQPQFIANVVKPFIASGARFNMVYYYGKPILFQYHESLRYQGSPHEGLIRGDGQVRSIELSGMYPDETQVRLNVRPIKRPSKLHFVEHYLRYFLFPWGSNHCLLGLEKQGDPNKLFPIREARRLAFREEVRKRGYPLTVAGVKSLFVAGLDATLANYVNSELILNDYYRWAILGDTSMTDAHDVTSIKPIALDNVANPVKDET